MINIGCVVQASGHSQRFDNTNKLMLPFRGQPLVAYTLRQLPQEALAKIVVVTRFPKVAALCQRYGLDYRLHTMPFHSDTIRLGLEYMDDMDGCMFCVGDQPFCCRETMLTMLDYFKQHQQSIVRAAWGAKEGSPVIFPRQLFAELSSLRGEIGGGAVIRQHRELVQTVSCLSERELQDVDTPANLTQLERL